MSLSSSQRNSLNNVSANINMMETYDFNYRIDTPPRSRVYLQSFRKIYYDPEGGLYELYLMDQGILQNDSDLIKLNNVTADRLPEPVRHFRLMILPH
ncbi:hypothetical protein P4V63_22955 [Bacillus toyonensis]|nr:hypothetical protein [Bacillus toyonensis]MEE2020783.1 hypothetical protein [Bacillus toyonensis]